MMSSNKWKLYSQSMHEAVDDHVPYEDIGFNTERMKRWDPLNRALCVGSRIHMPGLLLSHKGDRVAMHNSVETRYPFLDEGVFSYLAKLHPRWKMRGFKDKYILRKVAERWLPKEIAWRKKAMFRAPFDSFHLEKMPPFVDQLLSEESLLKSGYFDPQAVQHWRQQFRNLMSGSWRRTFIEMGLVGVVATQLWHQTFIDSSLADLPSQAGQLPAVLTGAGASRS
jgi:asparagine synthase (glutamine-hydrolysing)